MPTARRGHAEFRRAWPLEQWPSSRSLPRHGGRARTCYAAVARKILPPWGTLWSLEPSKRLDPRFSASIPWNGAESCPAKLRLAACRVAVRTIAVLWFAWPLASPRPRAFWSTPTPIATGGSRDRSRSRSRCRRATASPSLEINAKLHDTVAEVQVTQVFENTGVGADRSVVHLPAAVRRRHRPADAAWSTARNTPPSCSHAKEARERYEAIVRKSRDPALLEWVGNGMFQTSVFPIPPGAKRTVTLRYTQLCRKSHGLTDFLFPLSTAKYTAGELDKLVDPRGDREHRRHQDRVLAHARRRTSSGPTTSTRSSRSKLKNTIPAEDFRLFTRREDGDVAASVVSYRPETRRRRLLPAAGQPADQAARRRSARPRRSCSSSTARAA